MDRTIKASDHQDQPTHCTDRETEETEAESPKATQPVGGREKPGTQIWFSHAPRLCSAGAGRAFEAHVVQILSLVRGGNQKAGKPSPRSPQEQSGTLTFQLQDPVWS